MHPGAAPRCKEITVPVKPASSPPKKWTGTAEATPRNIRFRTIAASQPEQYHTRPASPPRHHQEEETNVIEVPEPVSRTPTTPEPASQIPPQPNELEGVINLTDSEDELPYTTVIRDTSTVVTETVVRHQDPTPPEHITSQISRAQLEQDLELSDETDTDEEEVRRFIPFDYFPLQLRTRVSESPEPQPSTSSQPTPPPEEPPKKRTIIWAQGRVRHTGTTPPTSPKPLLELEPKPPTPPPTATWTKKDWEQVEQEAIEALATTSSTRESTPTLDETIVIPTPDHYTDPYFTEPMERPWLRDPMDYLPRTAQEIRAQWRLIPIDNIPSTRTTSPPSNTDLLRDIV